MTTGSGSDPVLLLHGQPGGAGDWDRVVSELGGRVRAIAIDRPGWDGASPARGLRGNAEAAIATLDATGSRRATLVGHSFGGAVACLVALEQPERVSGLVLVAPSANVASLHAVDRLLAAPVVGELGSLLVVGAPATALRARATRRLIAAAFAFSEEHLERTGRELGRRSAWRAFTVEQRSLIRDLPSLESRLGSVRAPTVVLVGARDWVVPPASARQLALQIPGAEIAVIPRAGHLLALRHAGRVAEAILAA